MSIDGAHETYDYIRFPGKWKQIVKNIYTIYNSELIDDLCFMTVIQPVNLLALENWLPWFIEFHREPITPNGKRRLLPDNETVFQIVDAPLHFLMSVLPDDIKQDIAKDAYNIQDKFNLNNRESNTFINPIISILKESDFNPDFFKDFKKVINMLEKIRGNSLEQITPKYYRRIFK